MKKIIAMIFCLALCTLAFVGCDIDLDSYLDEDSTVQAISPSGDGASIYTFVLNGDSVSSDVFHFSTIQMSKVTVISGDQKITPKQFFKAMTTVTVSTDVVANNTDKIYSSANINGYKEVYDYTEEQLKAFPSITLDGDITVEIDGDASVSEVAIMSIGEGEENDVKTTLEELSALESGEYYIKITVGTEGEIKISDTINIFRLIVE
jgi:hypothetical protein